MFFNCASLLSTLATLDDNSGTAIVGPVEDSIEEVFASKVLPACFPVTLASVSEKAATDGSKLLDNVEQRDLARCIFEWVRFINKYDGRYDLKVSGSGVHLSPDVGKLQTFVADKAYESMKPFIHEPDLKAASRLVLLKLIYSVKAPGTESTLRIDLPAGAPVSPKTGFVTSASSAFKKGFGKINAVMPFRNR
jgi:hypothetical protein